MTNRHLTSRGVAHPVQGITIREGEFWDDGEIAILLELHGLEANDRQHLLLGCEESWDLVHGLLGALSRDSYGLSAKRAARMLSAD